MKTPEFKQFVAVCTVFHILPSERMKTLYGPLLPLSLTPVDWYAFDVAAAWVALELQRGDSDDNPVTSTPFESVPPGHQPGRQRPAIQQDGRQTTEQIRGTEVPPWARR